MRAKKYHMVYETSNTVNDITYIGVHSTNDLEDSYLGSGLLLLKAIKKYGKDKFTRKIIKLFDNRQAAYDYEESIVTEDMIKSRVYYNRAVGGCGGYIGEEAIERMRETKRGSIPWNKGKTGIYTQETLDSMSAKLRGRKVSNSKLKGLTKDKCKRLRDSAAALKESGKVAGVNNGCFKHYYITPKGEFDSADRASRANGICDITLRSRCKNKKDGYDIRPVDFKYIYNVSGNVYKSAKDAAQAENVAVATIHAWVNRENRRDVFKTKIPI